MPGEVYWLGPPTPTLIEEYSGKGTSTSPPADATNVGLNVGPRTGFSITPEGVKTEHSWDLTRTAITAGFTSLAGNAEAIGASTLDAGTAVTISEVVAGTFVDIEGFPYVCMALAILLGEYVFGWLLNKVANLIPNPSFFGWHPLGWLQHGLHNMGNGFEGSARGISHYLLGLILTPVHLIIRLFQQMINAISGAHNKSATIVTHRIPTAVREATAAASSYTDQSVATLQADQVAALDKLASDTAAAVAAGKIDAQAGVTSTLTTLQSAIMERVADDQATLDAIETALAHQLPDASIAALQAADATTSQSLIAQAATLAAQVAALTAQVQSHQATIATRESELAAAEATIVRLEAATPVDEAAVTYERGLVTTYQSDILSNIKAIEGLESQITARSTTLGQIHTVQQLRTTQNTGNEVVAVAALATVVATVAKAVYSLKTKVDQCMVDRCNPSGPHGLKTELLALLALLTDAGELAFLAEAVRDPLGTAQTIAPGLEAVDAAAVGALDALLSL